MENEIKPCPFCGQQPLNLSANLMCKTKGCAIENKPILRGQWNTRAIIKPPANMERTGLD